MATDIQISQLNEVTCNNDLNHIIINDRESAGDDGITKKIQLCNFLTPNLVKETNIIDSAVTRDKIAPLSVDCSRIANNTITCNQIAENTITNSRLGSNVIDNRTLNNNCGFTVKCLVVNDGPVKITDLADGCLAVESGITKLNTITYHWPTAQTPNRFLKTNGAGDLSWEEAVPGESTSLVFSEIMPVGTIVPWAGSTDVPDDKWLVCAGQTFKGTEYPELCAALGDTWGTPTVGGGYYLPDLQGRVIIGTGIGTDEASRLCLFQFADKGGEYKHELTCDEMPSHSHCLRGNDRGTNSGQLCAPGLFKDDAEKIASDPNSIHQTGGNQPHNNIQPYTVTRYIIKAKPDDVEQFNPTIGPGLSAADNGGQTANITLTSTEIGLKVSDDFQFDGGGRLEINDNFYDPRPGEIVQQLYYRVDEIKRYDAELIGTTGDRKTAAVSTAGAKLINMQELNFSREGTAAKNMYAGEVSDLRISITPKYADSLIVIEMNISCEPYRHNSGLWMGELNASNEIQLITRAGYEGYNSSVSTGRNNFYSSGWYDGNSESTMKSIPLTYTDKPNTTSEKTYSLIFGSAHSDAFLVINRSRVASNAYNYEYGVSTISIKEIRQ